MRNKKIEYKPLLFSTTVRNPGRIKEYVKILSKFQGEILDNNVIMNIIKEIIKNKLYYTRYEKNNVTLWEIFLSDNNFTNDQVQQIIFNSPQNHKEAGFDKGWPSRFDTIYKIIKEFGFVYYKMNTKIEISPTGQLLINSLDKNVPELEEKAFLNLLVKYQRNNPLRKVKNTNLPLILLLKLIKKLKDNPIKNNMLSKKELALVLCSPNDDENYIYNIIKKIREKFGFDYSDDIIYEKCLELLDAKGKEQRFKKKTILTELPDDFIRKIRMTGLISLRGFGKYIDYNNEELDKISYILRKYNKCKNFKTEYDYYLYMSIIDKSLLNITEKSLNMTTINSVIKWAKHFEWNTIKAELDILSKNSKSKNEILKFIDEPTRLEFLISLALKKHFRDIIVRPNYLIDDEGLPRRHAGGGQPDIICYDKNNYIIFEVTLLSGTQQCVKEMPPIGDHLRLAKKENPNAYSVFIAPNIHHRSYEYANFLNYEDNLLIISLTIKNLIEALDIGIDFKYFKNIKDLNSTA